MKPMISQENIQGIYWKIISCFGFASINALLKILKGLPPTELAFFQHFFGLILVSASFKKKEWSKEVIQSFQYTHVIRGLISAGGVVLWIYGLQCMGILQVVSLSFLGPFFTLIGSKIFFHEKMTLQKYLAVILGVIGGLFISLGGYYTDPGLKLPLSLGVFFKSLCKQSFPCNFFSNDFFPLFFPLLSTVLFSTSTLMAKKLVTQASPNIVAFYMMGTITAVLLLYSQDWVLPTYHQWTALAFLGLFCALAHVAALHSLAHADVGFLIPFGGIRCLFSGLLGYVFFSEIPNFWTFLGLGTIFLGIFVLNHKNFSP